MLEAAGRRDSSVEDNHCAAFLLSRPVVVSFEEFKDRDEVLRKAGLLRGSSIHVTEDMSRRVRESRQELRRFMREVRRVNPASVCNLQYDTLYVDKKCYKYSPLEGKVVEHSAAAVSPHSNILTISLLSPRTLRLSPETDDVQLWADPLPTLAPSYVWPAQPRRDLLVCTGK